MKALRLRVAQLETAIKTTKSKQPPAEGSAKAQFQAGGDIEAAKNLGRKFALLNEVFFDADWFKGPHPKLEILSEYRYDNADALLDCIRAELFDLVPPTLHKYLEKETGFSDAVSGHFLPFASSAAGSRYLEVLHRRRRLRPPAHPQYPPRFGKVVLWYAPPPRNVQDG